MSDIVCQKLSKLVRACRKYSLPNFDAFLLRQCSSEVHSIQRNGSAENAGLKNAEPEIEGYGIRWPNKIYMRLSTASLKEQQPALRLRYDEQNDKTAIALAMCLLLVSCLKDEKWQQFIRD